jgi:hypothetical protein
MTAYQTYRKGNELLEIFRDNDNESPRQRDNDYESPRQWDDYESPRQWDDDENPRQLDNVGTLVTWNQKYSIGDVNFNGRDAQTPAEYKEENVPEGSVIIPVFMYDHSIITIRTSPFSCMWDSSQVGFIYVTPEKIKQEKLGTDGRTSEEHAKDLLEDEIKVLDQYLRGEIYNYTLSEIHNCDSCGSVTKEIQESGGGWYDDDNFSEMFAEMGIKIEEWEKISSFE